MANSATRHLLVVLVTICVALTLAACGSSSSSSTSSTPSTGTANGNAVTATSPSEGAEQSTNTKPPAESSQGGPKSPPGGSSSAPTPVAPLRVSGGGSAQFHVEGGDNSVQDYGSEAAEPELAEVAERVHAFYVARVRGEWAKACSYLAEATARQLAASSPGQERSACAASLATLTKPVSDSLAREATTVDAAALRQEGSQAFLLYTAPPAKTVYAMPLRLEDGDWKLTSLFGDALPGAEGG